MGRFTHFFSRVLWTGIFILALAAMPVMTVACGKSPQSAIRTAAGTATQTPTPTETPPLSWDDLRNSEYPSDFPRSKIARLSNGVYEEEYVPGAATKLTIRMADFGAFGPLDENKATDAAVILISAPGGSGVFIHLVAVLNRDGRPDPIKPVLLGDRVSVRALRIEDHKVLIRMRVRGRSDPMAKLTREVTRIYTLVGDNLVLEDERTEDVPSAPPEQFIYDPQPIEVTPGTAPKTIDGVLKPGGIAHYTVRAEAGQELRLSIRSEFNNAILSSFGLDDSSQLVSRTEYATTWVGRVPASQEYAVKVITLAGHELKYSLTVQVLAAAPTSPPTATSTPVSTRTPVLTPTHVPVATPTLGPPRLPAPTPTQAPPSGPSAGFPEIPILVRGDWKLSERPLSALSPEATQFLQSRDASWGVAVIIPGEKTVYVENADQQLELASVAKVLIMLAVMDRATLENRYVGEDELELLWPMITESDNDSATYLWNEIGGSIALRAFLARIGITGVTPFNGPFWGTSGASARAVSLVLAKLAFGEILDAANRKLALDLLMNVIPAQRWGIYPEAEDEQAHGDRVGLKNGWYPEERGWRVNSTGFVVSSTANQPAYAIAIMTNLQSTWRYGIDTIEGTAGRIHAALHHQGAQP